MLRTTRSAVTLGLPRCISTIGVAPGLQRLCICSTRRMLLSREMIPLVLCAPISVITARSWEITLSFLSRFVPSRFGFRIITAIRRRRRHRIPPLSFSLSIIPPPAIFCQGVVRLDNRKDQCIRKLH